MYVLTHPKHTLTFMYILCKCVHAIYANNMGPAKRAVVQFSGQMAGGDGFSGMRRFLVVVGFQMGSKLKLTPFIHNC